MDVHVEDSGPSQKTLKVTVPPDQVQVHVNKVYQAANQQVEMKGFRKGKIPRNVLKQKFGDAILQEAKESIINETFREAMEGQKLDVVGTPRLEVSEEPLAEDGELSYTVEVDLRPDVEIADIKSIDVAGQSIIATDEEIDSALDSLAQQKRKMQSVDGELEQGDFAKVDLSYKLDGNEVVKKEGLQINAGIPVRGCDPEEFANKLLGQPKGATVDLPITYPDNFEKEEARGKEGDISITVNEILRFVAPPIDDELAKTYDFESIEKLREDLTEKINAEKERAEHARVEEEILDQLYVLNGFELPEGLVKEEMSHRVQAYTQELQRQGASEEDAKRRIESEREAVEEASRKGVRNLFLVEAIAKKEKLFVTEGDVEGELKRIASDNNTGIQEVKAYFEEKQLYGELRLELMNRKVRDFLRQTATITDSKEAEES